MSKFILLYKGAATDMSEMSEEQGKVIMAKWDEWMKKIGSALVDIGAPFGEGASVVDDGSEGTVAQMSGYSIIEAADLAAAKELVDGHPFLAEGKGNYAVEVFELTPVPFE